jgi:hypothetical protein
MAARLEAGNHEGHSAGAQKGNQNALGHGLVAFRNGVHRRTRRGRSLIDRRSAAGKNAVAVRDEILRDLGGAEGLAATKLVLVEMIARDVYFLDECDRRIFKAIYKVAAQERALEKLGKIKNPKFIGVLYGYRQGVARNLASNLLALGLEKAPPKQESLEEILAEGEEEEKPDEPQN